jgi:hypothetical protein
VRTSAKRWNALAGASSLPGAGESFVSFIPLFGRTHDHSLGGNSGVSSPYDDSDNAERNVCPGIEQQLKPHPLDRIRMLFSRADRSEYGTAEMATDRHGRDHCPDLTPLLSRTCLLCRGHFLRLLTTPAQHLACDSHSLGGVLAVARRHDLTQFGCWQAVVPFSDALRFYLQGASCSMSAEHGG